MFYYGIPYDLKAREWRAAYPGMDILGGQVGIEYTPHGAVILSENGGAFRFDAKEERWVQLDWKPRPQFSFDSGTLVYDYKRDCLWALCEKVYRYDFKTGKSEVVQTKSKLRVNYYGGKFAMVRETVCIPEADLALSVNPAKSKDGWSGLMAWDLNEQKYLVVDLPHFREGKEVKVVIPGHESGIRYDPEYKLVLRNQYTNNRFSTWAMRFDRQTAKIGEIAE
jgi:hypothetical protein